LAKVALDKEMERRSKEIHVEKERLEEARSDMRSALPAEVWEAIGIDPAFAERVKRDQPYSSGYVAFGTATVDGEELSLYAHISSTKGGRGVSLGVKNADTTERSLTIPKYGYLLGEKILNATDGEQALRGAQEENVERVGEFLLTAIMRLRQKREEQCESERKAIKSNIENASQYRDAEERIKKARGNALTSTFIAEVDRAPLVELAEKKLLEMELARERKEEQERTRRKDAHELLLKVAERDAEHMSEVEAYEEACKKWAEEETARLWFSWAGRKVRYVPRFVTLSDYDEFAGDIQAPVEEVFVNTGAGLGPLGGSEWLRVVDRYDGTEKRMTLGTILDEELVEFTEPITTGVMEYHRTYKSSGGTYEAYDYETGAHYVNVPPHAEEKPSEPPAKPITWAERIKDLDLTPLSDHIRRYVEQGILDFESGTIGELLDKPKFRDRYPDPYDDIPY
jgi:hypothetical protein